MYLLNLEEYKHKKLPYKIDTYSRCPFLLTEKNSSVEFKPASVQTVTDFSGSNPEYVTFEVPMDYFRP